MGKASSAPTLFTSCCILTNAVCSNGEVENIYKAGLAHHKYRMHQWITSQPQVRKILEGGEDLDPVEASRLAVELRKPFSKDFNKKFNRVVLNQAVKVLRRLVESSPTSLVCRGERLIMFKRRRCKASRRRSSRRRRHSSPYLRKQPSSDQLCRRDILRTTFEHGKLSRILRAGR